MTQRKLILFTSGDPHQAARPAWTAYHWALTALAADVRAEVRLAGAAVRILTSGDLPEPELPELMAKALANDVPISACPRSIELHSIPEEALRKWNVMRRSLPEVLTETAEGRAELIYLG